MGCKGAGSVREGSVGERERGRGREEGWKRSWNSS
jgi:hypothetical protein